jgi:hypothetical protein
MHLLAGKADRWHHMRQLDIDDRIILKRIFQDTKCGCYGGIFWAWAWNRRREFQCCGLSQIKYKQLHGYLLISINSRWASTEMAIEIFKFASLQV